MVHKINPFTFFYQSMLSWEIQVWQNKEKLTAFPLPQLLTAHIGQWSSTLSVFPQVFLHTDHQEWGLNVHSSTNPKVTGEWRSKN